MSDILAGGTRVRILPAPYPTASDPYAGMEGRIVSRYLEEGVLQYGVQLPGILITYLREQIEVIEPKPSSDPFPVGTRVRVLSDSDDPMLRDTMTGSEGTIVPASDPVPGRGGWESPDDPAYRIVQMPSRGWTWYRPGPPGSGKMERMEEPGYVYRFPIERLEVLPMAIEVGDQVRIKDHPVSRMRGKIGKLVSCGALGCTVIVDGETHYEIPLIDLGLLADEDLPPVPTPLVFSVTDINGLPIKMELIRHKRRDGSVHKRSATISPKMGTGIHVDRAGVEQMIAALQACREEMIAHDDESSNLAR